MKTVLEFSPSDHSYRLHRGKTCFQVLGVTRALSLAGIAPDFEGLARGNAIADRADLGTMVHEATALDDRNNLDEAALDPVLRPYVQAWRKARAALGSPVVEIERLVYSTRLMFAGRLDRVLVDGCIIDISIARELPRWKEIQCGGYALALDHMTRRTHRWGRIVRLCDGGFELWPRQKPCDLTRAKSIFAGALVVAQWRQYEKS